MIGLTMSIKIKALVIALFAMKLCLINNVFAHDSSQCRTTSMQTGSTLHFLCGTNSNEAASIQNMDGQVASPTPSYLSESINKYRWPARTPEDLKAHVIMLEFATPKVVWAVADNKRCGSTHNQPCPTRPVKDLQTGLTLKSPKANVGDIVVFFKKEGRNNMCLIVINNIQYKTICKAK